MADRMVEKVAVAIIADMGQQMDGKPKPLRVEGDGLARAALDACHFEELVTALEALMEDYEENTVGYVGDHDLNVPSALKEALVVLKKVEASDE